MPPGITSMPEPPVAVTLALPFTAPELLAMAKAALAEEAAKAVAQSIADETVISLAEAVAMTSWSVTGFKRVATKMNLPFIKGLHKSPPSYRRGDVVEMLKRMRVWPHGKPVEQAAA